MIKRFRLLIFFFAVVFKGYTQNYPFDRKFSPDELKEDAEILVNTLYDNHPGIYDYTSKAEFDSLELVFYSQLTDSLTQDEFHVHVRKFIRFVGCGHTAAKPSADWYKTLKGKATLIPVHVFLHNDELFIRKVFDGGRDSLIGARVLSVEGVSASDLLVDLKSIAGRDGVGETMVTRNVERLFQTYYMFLNGMSSQYSMKLEKSDGEVVELTLKGQVPSKYPIDRSYDLLDAMQAPSIEFGFLDSTRKVALINVDGFLPKGYKKIYRKAFKQLASMDSVDLVLDLRGNGGGFFPNGNQLLRYLMNDRFTMDFSRSKKKVKKNKHLKLNFISRVTRFIFATIPDNDKEDPDRNYQIRYKPKKRHHFNGQVFVLTDGLTFSASGFVASKLKNSGVAKVVGQESGGGEVGFNAVLTWKLSLPNTGVRVSVPAYHVDIQPEMEDKGRGVLPTIPAYYDSIQQRIDDFDPELEKVLQLLELN